MYVRGLSQECRSQLGYVLQAFWLGFWDFINLCCLEWGSEKKQPELSYTCSEMWYVDSASASRALSAKYPRTIAEIAIGQVARPLKFLLLNLRQVLASRVVREILPCSGSGV